jgi:hypothetical protein
MSISSALAARGGVDQIEVKARPFREGGGIAWVKAAAEEVVGGIRRHGLHSSNGRRPAQPHRFLVVWL